ncbi:MAG: T9SS type A sorting domain-containing protein [Ignavibacteria bacterium]
MNKTLTALAICCSIFIFSFSNGYSQNPTYTLSATNFVGTADSLTFEIRLLHTNSGTAPYKYALGQYFFRFNPAIANGGTLTYRILASDLPTEARPRNPTVFNNELRLATNAVIPQTLVVVSSTAPGTLIARMSLKTSASGFSLSETLNLIWKNPSDPVPFTKLFAYVGTVSTEITNAASHTVVSINQISTEVAVEFELSQNYPNPFNPSTKIKFSIQNSGFVSLKVYDIAGREVADLVNEKLNAGVFEYKFEASSFSSGTYFYRIHSGDFIETRRMMLIK